MQSDSEYLSWTSSALLTYDKSWITKIWHEDIAPCQTVLALKYCDSELPGVHDPDQLQSYTCQSVR